MEANSSIMFRDSTSSLSRITISSHPDLKPYFLNRGSRRVARAKCLIETTSLNLFLISAVMESLKFLINLGSSLLVLFFSSSSISSTVIITEDKVTTYWALIVWVTSSKICRIWIVFFAIIMSSSVIIPVLGYWIAMHPLRASMHSITLLNIWRVEFHLTGIWFFSLRTGNLCCSWKNFSLWAAWDDLRKFFLSIILIDDYTTKFKVCARHGTCNNS